MPIVHLIHETAENQKLKWEIYIYLGYISAIKYTATVSNLQIVFLQVSIFHYYRNGNTNIKKLTKRYLWKN